MHVLLGRNEVLCVSSAGLPLDAWHSRYTITVTCTSCDYELVLQKHGHPCMRPFLCK